MICKQTVCLVSIYSLFFLFSSSIKTLQMVLKISLTPYASKIGQTKTRVWLSENKILRSSLNAQDHNFIKYFLIVLKCVLKLKQSRNILKLLKNALLQIFYNYKIKLVLRTFGELFLSLSDAGDNYTILVTKLECWWHFANFDTEFRST